MDESSAIEAIGNAIEGVTVASAGNVEDAFQNALNELGDVKAPASWIDTPKEDAQYLIKEYAPEIRDLRDSLSTLQGKLSRVGIESSDLDAYIDDLNATLGTLQALKADPEAYYAIIEKSGGPIAMYNYQVEQEGGIKELLGSLQKNYSATQVASL